LADELAEVLRQPLSSPFASETIIVQSRDMERWIVLEMSRQLGIFAHYSASFSGNPVVSSAVLPLVMY